MAHDIQETYQVESPEQAMALLNPLRAEILSQCVQPISAAEIARQINEIPQRINYHLKALEKVGLVRRVGTRQVRNLVEVLYQAIARTYVMSEALGWGNETVQRIKDQGSLSHLITLADRMKRDALQLLEHTDQKENVPSASLQLEIHLETEEKRASFMQEYIEMVKQLTNKYQSKKKNADQYQVMLAVYPQPNQGGGTNE